MATVTAIPLVAPATPETPLGELESRVFSLYTAKIKELAGVEEVTYVVTRNAHGQSGVSAFLVKIAGLKIPRVLATFYLAQMHGCCGVCMSFHAHVNREFGNKGLGRLLNNLRIDLARAKGYGILMCTDVDFNTRQRSILKKNGWEDIFSFTNPRTTHLVNISIHRL